MEQVRAVVEGRMGSQVHGEWVPPKAKEPALTPISKLFEEDREKASLDEAEGFLGGVLPAGEDAALSFDPGEEAFNKPTSHVTA
jgi:hypothetical protein